MADVHGNWPALQALEQDAGHADFVIHAGDSVGYNPFAEECVNWLKAHADVNVMGDHDYALVNTDYKGFSREAVNVLSWTDQHISAINLRYLSNLQDTWVGEVGGVKFGVVHGGLTNPLREAVHAGSAEGLLDGYLKKLGVKVLVVGHLHQLFVRQLKDGLVINPGSVGQPRDQNPNPSYVILEVDKGNVLSINPRRFKYDLSKVETKINAEMLPKVLIERLKRGY